MAPENQTAKQLAADVVRQNEKIANIERSLFGNGQPGLEKRMIAYVDERLTSIRNHTNRNMEEGDGMVLAAVERETKERERQHTENRELHERFSDSMVAAMEKMQKKIEDNNKVLQRILIIMLAMGMAAGMVKAGEEMGFIPVAKIQKVQSLLE